MPNSRLGRKDRLVNPSWERGSGLKWKSGVRTPTDAEQERLDEAHKAEYGEPSAHTVFPCLCGSEACEKKILRQIRYLDGRPLRMYDKDGDEW